MNASVSGGISQVKNVIAVSSGKGGVGKSTVAVNLAIALRQQGKSVGLLDTDIHGPNIPTMMGVTDFPKIEKREGGKEIMIPPQAHGILVMSVGFLIDREQPVIWRGPMLHNLLTQFARDVDWGALDVLILDMPPGTGDVPISVAQIFYLRGAVIVTTPQEVAAEDVRRAMHMWAKVQVPVLGVVENMSGYVCDGCQKTHQLFGEGAGKRIAEKFGVSLLAQLPLVPAVGAGGDSGVPMTEKNPDSPVGKIFAQLAQQVLAHPEVNSQAAMPV